MKLTSLPGKRIRLLSISGNVFTGKVGDYIWPEDNEPEVEGIVLDDCYCETRKHRYRNPVEFDAPEIKQIEIIEEERKAS